MVRPAKTAIRRHEGFRRKSMSAVVDKIASSANREYMRTSSADREASGAVRNTAVAISAPSDGRNRRAIRYMATPDSQ
jgi:hypothetical protein